jgi:hypothetical protein
MKERVEGIVRGTLLLDHLIQPQMIRRGVTRIVPWTIEKKTDVDIPGPLPNYAPSNGK